ncbi:MAG: MFS transporter [Dehalococcoidia bacterium]|nr:MAG: MFS transporter [Dehalococcoidia bacterium]
MLSPSGPALAPPPAPSDHVGRPSPWHSPDYRLLLVGTFLAVLGMWVQQIGQGWYVLQLTGSAFDLSLVQAVSAVPMLVFGLLGGVVADRLDRRTLIIVTRSLIAALSFLLGVLMLVGWAPLAVVLLVTGLAGIVWAFDLPARQAMVPQLVHPRARTAAIAWVSTALNAGRILGPALGGIALGFIGAAGCVLVSALGYVGMVMLAARIRPLPPQRREQRDLARDLMVGLRYCLAQPTVLGLLLLAAAMIVFWQAHVVLLPVFARDVLAAGASGYGLLSAASGVGALAGTLSIALAPARRQGAAMAVLAVSAGGGLLLWAQVTNFFLSLVLLVLATACGMATSTLTTSMLQRITPDHLQGRVMSVALLTWGASPVGLLLAGALADLGGAPFSVMVTSSLALAASVGVLLLVPGVRRL